jgi:hypothetical protein
MVNPSRMLRALVLALLFMCFLALAACAFAQDFTLTAVGSGFSPASVIPGVPSTADISVQPLNTTTPPTVNLSCSVGGAVNTTPSCQISSSVVAPAIPVLTVHTTAAQAATYPITVTGTDASGSQSLTLQLTVDAVSPGYTITVATALNPSSLPSGYATSGVITVTPSPGYVNHMVTLACASVTPAVFPAPQCSFSSTPSGPPQAVPIGADGNPANSRITITSFNPNVTVTELHRRGTFYAAWLLLPGIVLAGCLSGRARHKKLLGLILLVLLAAGILLVPACSSNPTTTSTTENATTPNNTYNFTITAADENGLTPSNVLPTVTLTIN